MKKIFILYGALVVLVIVLLIWRAGSTNLSLFGTRATAAVGDQNIKLLIADNQKSRQVGLSNRRSLSRDTGMLFIFDKADKPAFWMRDVKFPLDIIFINNNKVVDIVKNAQPPKDGENPTIYTPDALADKVLEINGGLADEWGIKEGTEITFQGVKTK